MKIPTGLSQMGIGGTKAFHLSIIIEVEQMLIESSLCWGTLIGGLSILQINKIQVPFFKCLYHSLLYRGNNDQFAQDFLGQFSVWHLDPNAGRQSSSLVGSSFS